MAGIADAMAGMASGKRSGGIAERMTHSEHHEPDGDEHGDGVHEHLKALHATMGGKHMHVHHHEGGITTHHVGEDGKVEGPHDHENTEALKEHMGKFLDEEEHESPHEDHDGLM